MSTSSLPWLDAVFAHVDIGPLVVQWLDVATLLALRLTGRGGKQAADREFSLADARRRVRLWARVPPRRQIEGEYLMTTLAMTGELRLIQWARCGKRVAWDELTTATAAFYGHIHVIQWMCFEADTPIPYAKQSKRPTGYPRPGLVGVECSHAAKAGRLDVLDWLRARDFALSNNACHEAVREGHLHVLKRICFVCDPYATWLPVLLKQLEEEAFMCDFEPDEDDHTEEELARYKDSLRRWLPILEWYLPFATVSERREIYAVVPVQWFLS